MKSNNTNHMLSFWEATQIFPVIQKDIQPHH